MGTARAGKSRRRGKPARPPPVPRQPPAEPDDPDWIWVGDQRMFLVGCTSGGAPFGYVEGDELADDDPEDSWC